MSRKTLGGRGRATTYGTAAVVLLSLAGTAGAATNDVASAGAVSAFAAPTLTGAALDGKNLKLTGDNLQNATTVLVGDVAVKLKAKDRAAAPDATTSITLKAPSLKGGSYHVTVVTPDGIVSRENSFGAVPVVSKIVTGVKVGTKETTVSRYSSLGSTPTATIGEADGTQTVRLLGTGFKGLTKLHFGDRVLDATGNIKIESDTVAWAKIPAFAGTFGAKKDTAKVKVLGENFWGKGSKGTNFQYDALPTVTAADTTASHVTSATSTVTFTGTNLANAVVSFGTKKGKVTASSDTSVTVTVPKGTAGLVDIIVANKATVKGVAGKTTATTVTLPVQWTFSATAPSAASPWTRS